MVNAAQFIGFLRSAGVINLAAAQAAGTPAGVTFFTAIGFDTPTAQQLTAQLMSTPSPANPATSSPRVSSPVGPVGMPRVAPPGLTGTATSPTLTATAPTSPAAPPRLTVLPSGYPLVARP